MLFSVQKSSLSPSLGSVFSMVHSFFLHLLLSSRHFLPLDLKKKKKRSLPSLTPPRPLYFISLRTLLISTCLSVSVHLSVPPPPQGASGVLREREHVQGAPQAVLHQKPKIQWVALVLESLFFCMPEINCVVVFFSFCVFLFFCWTCVLTTWVAP